MAKKKKSAKKTKKKVTKSVTKAKKTVSARAYLNQVIAGNHKAKLSDRKIADKVAAAYPKLPSYSSVGLVKRARREVNSGSLRGVDKPKKAIPEFDNDGKIRAAHKASKKKIAKKTKAVRAKKKKTAKRRKKAAA